MLSQYDAVHHLLLFYRLRLQSYNLRPELFFFLHIYIKLQI